jgi:hypothetical protein
MSEEEYAKQLILVAISLIGERTDCGNVGHERLPSLMGSAQLVVDDAIKRAAARAAKSK